MPQKNLRQFDYKKVAKLDTDMWRAYYSHYFFKMFISLLQLMRTQFEFSWPVALKAAYYATVAATVYRVRKGYENFPAIEKRLVQFYKTVSAHATESFDYRKAAEIELEWWNIHRYPKRYKKTLGASLAEGMAIVYNGTPTDFTKYGDYRAKAMLLRDKMGGVQHVEPDWEEIESLLATSWQSLYQAAQRDT